MAKNSDFLLVFPVEHGLSRTVFEIKDIYACGI